MATNMSSTANTSLDFSYKVRASFYALSLDETYFDNVKDVPNIISETLPVMILMTAMELVVLRLQGMGDRFRLHNTVINYCTGALNEASRVFVFRGAEFTMYVWVFTHCRLLTLSWHSPWTYVLALLGVDFCNYWWHRLSHELSFMWAAHYVHHSSEDFNASVGARISFTMRPFKWVYFLPLALFGLPPSTYLVHSQLGLVWAFWVHCEAWPKTQKLVPVLGHIFEFFFSTPSHHRVHHAVNAYAIDKNYGTTLIIWDRLFGTFAEERDDEPITYGTISQKDNNHIVGLQADPWRDLWSRICSVKTFGDKLRTVVYGPAWYPGQPRLGDMGELPDVRGRAKHLFVAPTGLSVYLAIHCLLVLVSYIDMAPRVMEVNTWVQTVNLLYIFLAYGALGGLYSQHLASMWLEPIRLLISVPLFLLLPMFGSATTTTVITSINLASAIAWPTVRTQALAMATPTKKTQ